MPGPAGEVQVRSNVLTAITTATALATALRTRGVSPARVIVRADTPARLRTAGQLAAVATATDEARA